MRPVRRLLAWLCPGALAPALLRGEPRDFTLPAQAAGEALLDFSKQAGVEVLFSFDELMQVRSTAVIGRYEPESALARLLLDTGFTARRNGRGKFLVTSLRRPTGTIDGRLLAPDGSGAPRVLVRLPALGRSAATDDTGDFTFTLVPPGTYRVHASAPTYRSTEFTGVRVDAGRVTTLPPQRLEHADDPTRLDPFIVHAKSGRDEAFDHSRTPTLPQTATGNLDLSRTENDAIPYVIFDRQQITRSGVVNLNDFIQREILESDASVRSSEQDGNAPSFQVGSTNLNLRGYGSDETVVLVNGRRLPEVLTVNSGALPPDVSLIPISLVEQVEVLPLSASALYSGNPVGGVINIVLRPDVDVTELSTTYTNALAGYDAPQSSVSLQHGETLLGGALRLRLSATYTAATPATEAELGYIREHDTIRPDLDAPVFRATPNIRSADGTTPLFGPGSSTVTSVAPGASGSGGLAAFAGRDGRRNFDLFASPGGLVASANSRDYPYGRRQRRASYFLSTAYDPAPWLEVGVDGTYARTVVNRGYELLAADLALPAASPFNPFGTDVQVALNDYAPKLGPNYSEARVEFFSVVTGVMLKLPSNWRVAADAQYAHNTAKYRGLGGVDPARWQALVDQGVYNPLRDTQRSGPPDAFYQQVLIYRGGLGRFVTVGDYDTIDAAVRISNRSINLPTGSGALNVGGDYRRTHLADYVDVRRFADDSLASVPDRWQGRTLQRFSVFGELQGPLLPAGRRPRWMHGLEGDLAVRYIAADTSRETNVAPTFALKLDLAGGLALRGSVTTSNRVPTPQMSRLQATPGGTPGINLEPINDPVRQEKYDVQSADALDPNLRPESAVTQTAGAILQRGKVHRFRAAVDFVDTRKTNEVVVLDSQAVVNLESFFPERVIRLPLAPTDPRPAGRIATLVTGAVNVASRHSQNWNCSLDYTWTGCAGGTLEAYTRFLLYQRYDMQLFPNSPTIDELGNPDGTISGLLRHRANFGANWSNREWGCGVDGHFFDSRILPVKERLIQGGDRIGSHLQWDAFVHSDLGRWLPWRNSRFGLRGQLRVNNVLGTEFPHYASASTGVQPYGDWRGRTYSISVTATY
ncbi:MAG: carboxypeptidase regulatory-like domain-containing protein [Verrucomicrobia bacterium]|nr:carboxypeptidase regulatory-like domain-containing protein [Verrucomicrobiota bacterium]